MFTIQENKEFILEQLSSVDRIGNEKLVKMLEKSDFFYAPASVKHHLNKEGGLAEHCTNVFYNYLQLALKYGLHDPNHPNHIPLDSIRLESYLHDACKINSYKKKAFEPLTKGPGKQEPYLKDLLISNGKKDVLDSLPKDEQGRIHIHKEYASQLIDWLKNNPDSPMPEEIVYEYADDILPVGHGEKSVIVAQQYIQLKVNEIIAIRWHMGAWEQGVYYGDRSRTFNTATKMYPDVKLLQLADYEASLKEEFGFDYQTEDVRDLVERYQKEVV